MDSSTATGFGLQLQQGISDIVLQSFNIFLNVLVLIFKTELDQIFAAIRSIFGITS